MRTDAALALEVVSAMLVHQHTNIAQYAWESTAAEPSIYALYVDVHGSLKCHLFFLS